MYIIGAFGFTVGYSGTTSCDYCLAQWATWYSPVTFRVHRELCYIEAWHKLVAHT